MTSFVLDFPHLIGKCILMQSNPGMLPFYIMLSEMYFFEIKLLSNLPRVCSLADIQ